MAFMRISFVCRAGANGSRRSGRTCSRPATRERSEATSVLPSLLDGDATCMLLFSADRDTNASMRRLTQSASLRARLRAGGANPPYTSEPGPNRIPAWALLPGGLGEAKI